MDIHKFIGKVYGKRLSAKLTGILLLAVIAAITQFLSAFYLGRITDSISLGKETVIARTIVIAMIKTHWILFIASVALYQLILLRDMQLSCQSSQVPHV